MYSQVGPQAAASVIQKGVLHGGVGEGDVLLGEARVPFSLLKEVPFHYLPLRIQRPAPPPRVPVVMASCGGDSGMPTTHNADGRCINGVNVLGDPIPRRRVGWGGKDWNADQMKTEGADKNTIKSDDSGLLGIGVRMVFPNPVIPDAPDASSDGGSVDSSVLPPSVTGSVDSGKGTTARCVAAAATATGDEILLTVYEAEALVRVSLPRRNMKLRGHSCREICFSLAVVAMWEALIGNSDMCRRRRL